jgi:hypothetical protein
MILLGNSVSKTPLIQTPMAPTLCAWGTEIYTEIFSRLSKPKPASTDIANYSHIYTANPNAISPLPPSFLPDWLQLTGLIHDVGKLLALWGEPQWAAVGDTFPVGCAFAKECVFSEQFQENPDFSHPVYRSAIFPGTTTSLSHIIPACYAHYCTPPLAGWL